MEYRRNKVPQLGEKSKTLLTYNLFLDDDSDESDTDFNNVFSRDENLTNDEDEIEENVVTFTLELNDKSKIEINYITLVSDSEEG